MSTPLSPALPGDVIGKVSEAVRSFICRHVPDMSSEASVIFDSPAGYDGTNEDRLSLYLYQIELNPELRNTPDTLSVERGSSGATAYPAPLAVDLSYMLVAYGKSYEREQVIAANVVGLLDRCGCIPAEFVTSPTLTNSGNSKLWVVPQPATTHTLRDLWAGFPNKAYHLTKLYTISPVRLPALTGNPVDVVLGVEVDAGVKPDADRPEARSL
jgi:hypothetical protein